MHKAFRSPAARMDKSSHAAVPSGEPTGPTDRLPLKIYGVMAVTTVLTFMTLTTGYRMLFSQALFA